MINNIMRFAAMVLGMAGIVFFFSVVAPETVSTENAYSQVNTVQSDLVFQQLVKEHDVQGLVEEEFGVCLTQ